MQECGRGVSTQEENKLATYICEGGDQVRQQIKPVIIM